MKQSNDLDETKLQMNFSHVSGFSHVFGSVQIGRLGLISSLCLSPKSRREDVSLPFHFLETKTDIITATRRQERGSSSWPQTRT